MVEFSRACGCTSATCTDSAGYHHREDTRTTEADLRRTGYACISRADNGLAIGLSPPRRISEHQFHATVRGALHSVPGTLSCMAGKTPDEARESLASGCTCSRCRDRSAQTAPRKQKAARPRPGSSAFRGSMARDASMSGGTTGSDSHGAPHRIPSTLSWILQG